MKKILSVLVCVCVIVSAMVCTTFTASAAETTTVTYTTSDYSDSSSTGVKNASKTFNDGILTFSAYEGGSSGSVAFRSDEIRLYQGAYATLTSTKDITSVTLNIKAKAAITIDVLSSTDGSSWTTVKSGISLTTSFANQTIDFDPATKYIKISEAAKQVIIKSITVTYAAEGGAEPACEHTATSTEANGNETHKVVCADCGETVTATVDCTDADVNGKCDVCGGDVEIPVQDPAADSTLSIVDAAALGASKDHNTYTAGKYYIEGKIAAFQSNANATKYGNFYLEDDAGNQILIYGTYSEDGTVRYDSMETKPVAGDTVKLYGVLGQYNGTAQMKNAWLIEHTPATTPDPDPTPDAGDDNTGDDNTGDDNTGDDNTGDDNTGDAPVADLAVVDSVVADKAYKFGMIQGNVSTTDVYYLAGGMDGYYMATTTDADAAIDIYVEETTGGYYLYTMIDGVKTYINMVVNGTHVNGAYEAAASTVYTFDATAKTFVATVNEDLYWFATRNDNTYTTLGPAKVSYNGFYGQFYAEPIVDDGNDDTTNDDTTGDSNTNTDNSTTSPDTGDNVGAFAVMAIAAAAVVITANKKRA